jgi:hypothetical protein
MLAGFDLKLLRMKLIQLTAFTLLPVLAYATESTTSAVIRLDTIEGAHDITVRRGQKQLHLKEGETLKPKDEVVTGPKESVRITFPDGSQFWVGRATTVRVFSGVAEGGHPIQFIHVIEGAGRVLVRKSYETTKKIKFVVKTKATTMGVRGTDFVVTAQSSGKEIDLHTLEGSVDAAKDVQSLINHKGISVNGGYMIHAFDTQPLPTPQSFDVQQYQAALNQQQPAFATFSINPVKYPEPETQKPTASPGSTQAPVANPNSLQGIKEKVEQDLRSRESELNKY